MDANSFRDSLIKIMPGYSWTVHRVTKGSVSITATGIQSSGFNRLSTLEVTYSRKRDQDWYAARSSGFGRRAPWLHENGDVTLARALRGLQDHYRMMVATYGGHQRALQNARAIAKATGAA
jgi:hypothetical protein